MICHRDTEAQRGTNYRKGFATKTQRDIKYFPGILNATVTQSKNLIGEVIPRNTVIRSCYY
jgi:hypothetical protein